MNTLFDCKLNVKILENFFCSAFQEETKVVFLVCVCVRARAGAAPPHHPQ